MSSQQNIGVLAGRLYELLKDLDASDRIRVVGATMMLFGDPIPETRATSLHKDAYPAETMPSRHASFGDRVDPTPKQFMLEKQPRSDIEKVACLAYYLTHYRDAPHFKTVDISKLNTEAAQIKFGNASKSVFNASTKGLLVAASKGTKQISAAGEEYVAALPDYNAANEAFKKHRSRRPRLTKSRKTSTSKKT